jgi:ankyrin repeat protein
MGQTSRKGEKAKTAEEDRSHLLLEACSADPWLYSSEYVEGLIGAPGVDVNATDGMGWTPLLEAITWCGSQFLRRLLDWGARADAQTMRGTSALHILANDDDSRDGYLGGNNESRVYDVLERADLLLRAGLPVDASEMDGTTPLMIAASNRALTLAELLLSWGADVERRDTSGRTAFLVTASHPGPSFPNEQNGASLELLLNYGADRGAVDNRGRNALALAVDADAVENVETLLRHGVDPTCPTLASDEEARLRPLLAAAVGDLEALRVALDLPGANPDVRTTAGRTPLLWAVSRGFKEGVLLLLERGADPNAEDKQSYPWSALRLAVHYGHVEIARLLLLQDLPPQKVVLALRKAVEKGDWAMVSQFLEVGAPVVHDGLSPDPFDVAAMGHGELLRAQFAVRDRLATTNHPVTLEHAVMVGDKEMAEVLLREMRARKPGPDWHRRWETSHMYLALLAASRNGDVEFVSWLLAEGAVADYSPEPLRFAAIRGHQEVVRLLLAASPKRNRAAARNLAAWAISNGQMEVAAMLDEVSGF